MNRPTFFIIGAGKSGTTSLAYYLAQHPEVMISDPKEPVFFQIEYAKGLDFYWKKYFSKYRGEMHVGEAAHQNSRLPYVARRIHTSYPHSKILMICRNPTDRAFSAYWHNFVRKQERRSFEEAIEENLERLARGPLFETDDEEAIYQRGLVAQKQDGQVRYASYVDSGYYARHIQRYAFLYGSDSVKVVFFEDLAGSTNDTIADIWRFLGLDPVKIVDEAVQNSTASPAMANLARLAFSIPGIRGIPPGFRSRVRSGLSKMVPGSKPSMSQQMRDRLRRHFEPENAELEIIASRKLAHWNE